MMAGAVLLCSEAYHNAGHLIRLFHKQDSSEGQRVAQEHQEFGIGERG